MLKFFLKKEIYLSLCVCVRVYVFMYIFVFLNIVNVFRDDSGNFLGLYMKCFQFEIKYSKLLGKEFIKVNG